MIFIKNKLLFQQKIIYVFAMFFTEKIYITYLHIAAHASLLKN